MSSRPGASNQSRERNRRAGFRSDIQDSRCEAGNIELEAEQAAGKRLLGELLLAQMMASRRRERRAKVAAAKGELGDVGTRKAHARYQLARGRVASRRGAMKQADPHAAFGVGYRPVRMASAIFDPDKDAFVGRAPVACKIECVDRAGARIGVIEDAPVGTEAGTIGDRIAAVDADWTVGIKTVERAGLFLLVVVHRAEP